MRGQSWSRQKTPQEYLETAFDDVRDLFGGRGNTVPDAEIRDNRNSAISVDYRQNDNGVIMVGEPRNHPLEPSLPAVLFTAGVHLYVEKRAHEYLRDADLDDLTVGQQAIYNRAMERASDNVALAFGDAAMLHAEPGADHEAVSDLRKYRDKEREPLYGRILEMSIERFDAGGFEEAADLIDRVLGDADLSSLETDV